MLLILLLLCIASSKNCTQLVQIYSLQTYLEEAWILYGLDKTIQKEILGQSGYLRARANVGMNSLNRHEQKDVRLQLLQQFDPRKVEFNTWLTSGTNTHHKRDQ